jgi:23S rRNA (cytidine1920-2'-O)/16S rRNA (cytidine1409-2'-O)-methyltransferase
MRADQALVARGLAASRTAAQRLIADGAVRMIAEGTLQGALGEVLRRSAHPVNAQDVLRVDASDETRFVSRAGAKLLHALNHFGLDPAGQVVLDLGQSTGGFTDCLLQAGAAAVVGVDVGHGQLHERMRTDPRVICIEHTHVRDLDRAGLHARVAAASKTSPPGVAGYPTVTAWPSDGGYAMAVVDLSFISLTQVLSAIDGLLAQAAQVLLLVKPQFELGPAALDRRGIVRDETQARQALQTIGAAAQTLGWSILGQCDSAVRGADGNLEFFLYARTGSPRDVAGPSS